MAKTTKTQSKPEGAGLSYVVPVYNEEHAIASTVDRLRTTLETLNRPFEIIIVNDGSSDNSYEVATNCQGVTVVSHPTNAGYGAALKTGIATAQYEWIGIVDADGTYEIEKIPDLVRHMEKGFDMVVATRSNVHRYDGPLKKIARKLYISVIKLLVNTEAQDPNSGLRIFKKSLALTFAPFLCNAFSFTTSITIFALGDAYFVKYLPTEYTEREGKSKVTHFRDTLRTIQLIVQGVTFFNPVKLYLFLALSHIVLVAVPSAAFLWLDWVLWAWIYFFTGTTSCLLVSLGALGDIVRISSMRPRAAQVPDLKHHFEVSLPD